MQKVLRRSAAVKRRADKKTTDHAVQNAKVKWNVQRRQDLIVRRQITNDILAERKRRREEWELGPLAPKRDVGDSKDSYGTVDAGRIKGSEVHPSQRTKRWNIVEGDRVVIIEGRDKGQIGLVTSTDRNTEEVTVRGFNMVDVKVPEFMRVDSQDQRTIQSVESAIPLKNVRLIHALRDKKTGRTRDVIVRELVSTTPTFDPRTGKASRNRIIPGLNVGIPWPKKRQPSYKEYPGDTSRLDTETKTWVPTLQTAPFPTSVMDELRNKFSKFRTRHDEDFVLQKMAQDEAVKARAASVNTMLTPIQELNRRIRAEKRALGKPELTWEMLAKIGETIAKNKRITPEQLPAASKEDSGSTLEIVSSTTSSISEGITDDVSLDTQETTPSNTKDQGQGLS